MVMAFQLFQSGQLAITRPNLGSTLTNTFLDQWKVPGMQSISPAAFANWKGKSKGGAIIDKFPTEIQILKHKV